MKAATRKQGDPGLRAAPQEMDDAPVSARTIGRFQCEVLLARKGAFETWRARLSGLQGLEKFYAVKCVRPDLLQKHPQVGERFLAGGRRARTVRDPRLAQVIDAGTIKNATGDLCFVATEFVQGLSLDAFVEAARGQVPHVAEPLPAELCAHIGAEIARALVAAHGLVPPLPHGRISPSNLIVTPQGQVRVLDLGITQAVDDTALVTDEWPASSSIYLAPELGTSGASTAGDLYALGVLLHELASGQAPPSPLAEEVEVATELPVLPAALAEVVAKLIEPTPERRPDALTAAGLLEGVRDEAGGDVRVQLAALAQRLATLDRATTATASPGGDADGVIFHEGWGAPEPTASMKLAVDGVPTELGALVADMKPGAVSRPTPVMGVVIATPPEAPSTDAVPKLEMAPITTEEIAAILPPEMKSRPFVMAENHAPIKPPSPEPPVIAAAVAERAETDIKPLVATEPEPAPAAPPKAKGPATGLLGADRHRKDTVPMPTFEEFAKGGTEAEFFTRGDEQSAAARASLAKPDNRDPKAMGGMTAPPSALASALQAIPRTWLLVGTTALGVALVAGVGGYMAGQRSVNTVLVSGASAPRVVAPSAETGPGSAPPVAPQPDPVAVATANPTGAGVAAAVSAPAGKPVAPLKITIRSNPAGATIWFAGRERAKTPAELPLPPSAALTLVRPGFQMARITLSGASPVDLTLSPTVAPAFGQATLRIMCRTRGRFPVLVDGSEVGLLCPIERLGLRPGAHEIAIFDPATGETQTQHVDMKAGVKTVKFAR